MPELRSKDFLFAYVRERRELPMIGNSLIVFTSGGVALVSRNIYADGWLVLE